MDEADPAGEYRYCGDVTGSVTLTSPDYNAPTAAEFTTSQNDDRFHEWDVYTVDVGGNLSPAQKIRFRPRRPQCPPSDSYCPGAAAKDGCDKDCPDGTKPSDCGACGTNDSCGRYCGDCPQPPNPPNPPNPGPGPGPGPSDPEIPPPPGGCTGLPSGAVCGEIKHGCTSTGHDVEWDNCGNCCNPTDVWGGPKGGQRDATCSQPGMTGYIVQTYCR